MKPVLSWIFLATILLFCMVTQAQQNAPTSSVVVPTRVNYSVTLTTMLKDSSVTLNANSAGGLTTPGAMTLGSTYTIGLKPCSTSQILEYSGSVWNCAAAGTGTITGVTAGSDLTGGGTSGKVTLNLDTTKVPLLAAGNIFTNGNTFNANSGVPVLALNNTGSGDGIDLAATGNGKTQRLRGNPLGR